tara:strand:+ start:114 stop:770 length:657 start_codon:yes stop_codon:yes gene_type:complete
LRTSENCCKALINKSFKETYMTASVSRKKQTRLKIIDAYLELLGRMGFQEITVTALCQEAGVARKTLYSHFSSKEEILDSVSQRVMFTGAIAAFTNTLSEVAGTRARIDETFTQLSMPFTAYTGERMGAFIQLIQNMTMRLSSYSGKFSEFRQSAVHYFSECKKCSDTRDDFDESFIADLTVNAAVGIILSWVSDPSYPASQRMEELKNHIASLILDG